MSLSRQSNKNTDPEVQERYLREITLHFRGLSKPLKWGPKIETLQELIDALHMTFETNYVNIELVNHIMLTYKSNSKEWQKYAKFDRFKYTRNLVDAGNGKFNLILLCWGEGHGSAIHDHSDSHCFMKMLKGELTEIRYEWPNAATAGGNETDAVDIGSVLEERNSEFIATGKELKEITKSTMGLNDVAYINDNLGLHRVMNPSYVQTAVSLHLYCPPFDECSVYQSNSGMKRTCAVTFYSKYVYFEDDLHEYLKGLPMLQSQRERVERAISEMIEDMYKTHLRKMQSDMHYCAARCCEDRRGTLDSVQVCIEDCAVPLIKAQDYLAHELGQFQGRLQNCVMQCNDDVRRQIPTSPKDPEVNRYRYQFERCTVSCVDKHIGLIPSMMKTIKTVLAKGPDGTRQA